MLVFMVLPSYSNKKRVKLQIYIDYRVLNKQIISDSYYLPRVDDFFIGCVIIAFSCAQIEGRLSLVSNYSEDWYKTDFAYCCGTSQFYLPFGPKNAPSTFLHIISMVFFVLLDTYVVSYLDDLLTISKIIEEHQKALDTVYA